MHGRSRSYDAVDEKDKKEPARDRLNSPRLQRLALVGFASSTFLTAISFFGDQEIAEPYNISHSVLDSWIITVLVCLLCHFNSSKATDRAQLGFRQYSVITLAIAAFNKMLVFANWWETAKAIAVVFQVILAATALVLFYCAPPLAVEPPPPPPDAEADPADIVVAEPKRGQVCTTVCPQLFALNY